MKKYKSIHVNTETFEEKEIETLIPESIVGSIKLVRMNMVCNRRISEIIPRPYFSVNN